MRILLIANHNSYVGREYFLRLNEANIDFDVVIIGEYSEHNEIEDKRCNNLWFPPFINLNNKNVYRFPSLKCSELAEFLDKMQYDVAIQGGTGILKNEIISKFKIGILNFHPGDLPEYRGCMAPEWQILEDRKVISTCHLVDEGIDTGDIIEKKELDLDYSNYHKLRAGIYPETAKFVIEIIEKIQKNNGINPSKQDETIAKYRKVMPEELLYKVVSKMEV